MKMEADAGTQTRLFHFGDWKAPGGAPTLQGDTTAQWETGARGRGANQPPPMFGNLKTVTKNLRPGYLRKNGVPYSDKTTLTEYWDLARQPNGDQWIIVTTVVEDPTYLARTWITSLNFKKEPNGSKWDPSCRQVLRVKTASGNPRDADDTHRCHRASRSSRFMTVRARLRPGRRRGRSRRPRVQGSLIDLSGTWANRLHEDWIERAPGPHIGDYTGLPINDEARAIADAYQVSMQNMPERQCILYTSQYIVMGPQNLRIQQELDPITGGRGGLPVERHGGSPAAHHLDGRPRRTRRPTRRTRRAASPPAQWEGADADRDHHAPEDRAGVAQRRAAQRPGDDGGALHPPREHAHGDDDPHRPDLLGGAVHPQRHVRARRQHARAARAVRAAGGDSAQPRARCRTTCRAPTRT